MIVRFLFFVFIIAVAFYAIYKWVWPYLFFVKKYRDKKTKLIDKELNEKIKDMK